MRSELVLAALLAAACGAKPAPTSPPPATGSGTGSGSALLLQGSCPTEIATAVGQPCSAENASCGAERCRTAAGFCNVIVCQGGVWRNLEVPPPPPAS